MAVNLKDNPTKECKGIMNKYKYDLNKVILIFIVEDLFKNEEKIKYKLFIRPNNSSSINQNKRNQSDCDLINGKDSFFGKSKSIQLRNTQCIASMGNGTYKVRILCL